MLAPAVASGYVITNADHGRVAPVVLTELRVRYLGGSGVLGARGLYEWLAERAPSTAPAFRRLRP